MSLTFQSFTAVEEAKEAEHANEVWCEGKKGFVLLGHPLKSGEEQELSVNSCSSASTTGLSACNSTENLQQIYLSEAQEESDSREMATFSDSSQRTILYPVLEGFREKLSFCVMPLPKKLKRVSFRVVEVGDGKLVMQLFDPEANCFLSLLETTSDVTKGFSRRDLILTGVLPTTIGKIVRKGKKDRVVVKSMKRGLHNGDRKGRIIPNIKMFRKSTFHEVSSVSVNNKNVECNVTLESVRTLPEWDALHSLTGYYGVRYSSPYHKHLQAGALHSCLLNEEGRSLDHLGDSYTFEGVKMKFNTTTDRDNRSNGFEIVNGNKTNPEVFLSVRGDAEGKLTADVCWPLSPVQAFGIMLSYISSSR